MGEKGKGGNHRAWRRYQEELGAADEPKRRSAAPPGPGRRGSARPSQPGAGVRGAEDGACGLVITVLYPSRVKGFAYVTGAVLVVIGLGVGISAATGNGGLSLALTCAPANAREYGPPGAQFTARFPGPVSLFVPAGVVDRAPDYELCGYSATTPKGSALWLAAIDVRAEPQPIQLARPSKKNGITAFTTGDASGIYDLRCYFGGGGCSGLMIV